MNKRRLFLALALLLLAVLGITATIALWPRELSNSDFNYWLQHGELPNWRPIFFREAHKIWQSVHRMSHHVVLSYGNEQWGFEPLTEERVNWLIREVFQHQGLMGEHRDELLVILIHWKNGNFSRTHRDHNAVWTRLGGDLGWAYGVRTAGIPAWAVANREAGISIGPALRALPQGRYLRFPM